MRITDWKFKEKADTAEVSAEVDGFRLWYRYPRALPASRAADPFLAAALLPAMLQGQEIEVDPGLPVSPKLLKNLQGLQEVFHCWNPIFKIIRIVATTSPAVSLREGAMSFFSGGVDSTYTFLKRIDELTHLVFIQGFDFFANVGESGAFSVGDLADLSQLVFKLTQSRDAISQFLKGVLSKNTLQALSNYQPSGAAQSGLEAGLAEDLKKTIGGPTIWEAGRFAGVRLRPETKDLLEKNLQGEELCRLNRMLLEDAYPLEIARRDSHVYETAIERNTRFARSFGKALIPVSTNYFPFGYRYNLSRNLSQGGALASTALLLGFPKVYVPASVSYDEIVPEGSHLVTDPLWSNEGVDIIHDGAEFRRVEKIANIVGNERALENLRVCFNDMNSNCGKCAKCLRTMIPLKLLDVSSAPFPALPTIRAIQKMRLPNIIEMVSFKENLAFARGGENKELQEALNAVLKRYERKRLLKEIDRLFLGGIFKRARRRFKKNAPGMRRIDSTPPQD